MKINYNLLEVKQTFKTQALKSTGNREAISKILAISQAEAIEANIRFRQCEREYSTVTGSTFSAKKSVILSIFAMLMIIIINDYSIQRCSGQSRSTANESGVEPLVIDEESKQSSRLANLPDSSRLSSHLEFASLHKMTGLSSKEVQFASKEGQNLQGNRAKLAKFDRLKDELETWKRARFWRKEDSHRGHLKAKGATSTDKHLNKQAASQLLSFDDQEEDLEQDRDDQEERGEDAPREFNSSFGATNSTDFSDFDDFQALGLDAFYGAHINASARRPTAAASQESGRVTGAGPLGHCALELVGGGCITFAMVEWAASLARRWLRLRPDDLDDLESSEPSEATVNSLGELNQLTSEILTRRLALSDEEVHQQLEQIDISRTSLWRSCPRLFRQRPVCTPTRYRTFTGHCNNLLAPQWGASQMPFMRALPAAYADLTGEPRRWALDGAPLPPARLVSIELHPDVELASGDLSMMFVNWGQLIGHDISLASIARESSGHAFSCCERRAGRRPAVCMPIEVAPVDFVYGRAGVRCLDFKRALAGLRPGCSLGPRIQSNLASSFIDGSFIYGPRRSLAASLRAEAGGRLAAWAYFGSERKPLLPAQRQAPDSDCQARPSGLYCFRSGDARTNQQAPLALLHTLHFRHHNRLASQLEALNPHWPNWRLYQEARHIHIAIIQHILLNEYLPVLLGAQVCDLYNLTESPLDSYWNYYEASMNPSIWPAFSVAAFRQGHSTVGAFVHRLGPSSLAPRSYRLRDLFQRPWLLFEPGAIDELLVGLLAAPSQQFDPFISGELSGHLLQVPGRRLGHDLVAINIQRGRDQGLASYNDFRQWCQLGRASSFEALERHMSKQSVERLAQLYGSVDDVDLFTGGLYELPLEGGQVGPTFACIIGRQFQRLRLADRFWFEAALGPQAFTLAQLASIKQVTLARLLCVNSDSVQVIVPMAFHLAHPILNPPQECTSLPDLEIELWRENSQPPS